MRSIRANGGHYLSYSLAESPSGELRYQSSRGAAHERQPWGGGGGGGGAAPAEI